MCVQCPQGPLPDGELGAEHPGPTSVDDGCREPGERLSGLGLRSGRCDRSAGVAAFPQGGVERYLPEQRHSELLGQLRPPPSPKRAWREPSGAVHQLMFSITPRIGRLSFLAM